MSQNNITGDEITSKAASQLYRTNYDRIFRKQDPPKYKEVVKTYKKIGCANSTKFKEPEGSGPWRRCHQSVSGCYEVYCDDRLKIYYDSFCD